MHRASILIASLLLTVLCTAPLQADMRADSPVTFPATGALPSKYPPDRPSKDRQTPEEGYSIFSTPERSLEQIAKIQAEMPAGEFTPPRQDWKHLQRTRQRLTAGGPLRLLAVGDSIVNDTMRSGWVALLQQKYPRAEIQATVYVRGGGGCQHYKEEGRVGKHVVPRRPDLVFIGGISQQDIESIREVIRQLRAELPEVEILLASGTFGTADPRDPEALARAKHSGTGSYGAALQQLASDQRCAYLDMTTPWAEYIRSTGLHPHLFYRDVVHANEQGEQILAKILMAFFAPAEQQALPAGEVTAAAYLAAQPAPRFRPGHTLPPLTRFGWTLPLEARIELAERWGYALEFGGYATEKQVAKDLADPDSTASRLCALTAADPSKYPLAVIVSRDLPQEVPPETWTRDGEGRRLNSKGIAVDGGAGQGRGVWSPEAPDEVFQRAGELRAEPLRRIRQQCPIAIVLNGGEYALGVLGFCRPAWEKDPRIVQAKGERSWFDYVSQRKAHQELIISEAIRQGVPDRILYNFYTAGGGTHRNRIANWQDWCWDYACMQPVSDLPSNETYYRHYNDGWTGRNDMLTLALNAAALEIASGHPLSYNWLCAGWTREDLAEDRGLGDLQRYAGFLKCYYTAGMIGGNAGYYEYPSGGFHAKFPADQPPHWLRQMLVLARVHAQFSHHDDFLRQGDLLPGPQPHRISPDLPAYEFPTGDADVRVLVRRSRGEPRWLVTAWAAAGPARDASVQVPELGAVTIGAHPAGAVYEVRAGETGPAVSRLDRD